MAKAVAGILLLILPHILWAQEIELPAGLGNLSTMIQEADEDYTLPFDLSGFLESRIGRRLQNDAHEKGISIGEIRLQIGVEKEFDSLTFNFVSDFIYDPVLNKHSVDLETGQGYVDIREANITFSPLEFMDVKVGRQVLTWGTGDLVFINDLFPKDWNSFFIGRDDEYLKAPSDAIKTGFFFGNYNLDIIYTPRFDADRFIDGSRISFFDRAGGDLSGRENPVVTDRPDRWFGDDELALRFYRSFGAYETALYYYNGFWKSPAGQDITTGQALFPRLQVFGATVRGPLSRGIASVEAGYYKSADGAASNPLVRNDEFRLLVGYEQEIATEFTGSVQYYLERKLDYDQYLASLPNGAIIDRQNRHLFMIRLTKLLRQQDLRLSLFNFYSPSDRDGYLRLNISYKIRDNIKVEVGGNIFYGQKDYSFFGQLKDNSNIFTALRYDF
ncbi:MAG: hypothetical protein COB49_06195 [Alphaproteobacteria bacterium]|nr:MAG: hypothetical protein COB49_06195 [Alphaproteobacteria bacterium]